MYKILACGRGKSKKASTLRLACAIWQPLFQTKQRIILLSTYGSHSGFLIEESIHLDTLGRLLAFI